ncbi:MAG: dihydrodipicolinate synthase family protein [Planctomycetes bacterium]|nr:dihydrodipicolinate synthase family protein [Planctomycetota bacterium]
MPAPTTAPVRLCFAAAHVVLRDDYAALPHRLDRPGDPAEIAAHVDWDATMAIRRRLDGFGLGIAEAMDTAQRFLLGWPSARELIVRCGALDLLHGFCAGAGTDHLPAVRGPADCVDGVVFQARLIQRCGGIPVLLPMPWLSRQPAGERTYVDVYRAIVRQLDGPLFVHWLGPMFLPDLAGYFPGDSFRAVMAIDREKVRGCKLSLLDDALELAVRRELLPHGQIVLTGDDFHFGRLLLGGDPRGPAPQAPPPIERWTTIGRHHVALGDFSHALLGILDGIAAPAQQALQVLARGDAAAFLRLMAPCETLGQHVFGPPTQHYKAGLAFLAWRNGWQQNPMLVNREDLARDAAHYARCEDLARACGALP